MTVEVFIINNLGMIKIISFLLGMFFIEETLFTLSFLSSQNIIGIHNIFFAFLGVIFYDVTLYFIGKSGLISPLKKFTAFTSFLRKMELKTQKFSRNKIERALFFSKFILGGRLILTMILGYRKVRFRKFFLSTVLVELVWASISISIGIFAGEGYKSFSHILSGIIFIASFITILSFVVFYIKKRMKQNI